MSELRSYPTRARITPTSFVNEYSFGSFEGDEDTWMEKYQRLSPGPFRGSAGRHGTSRLPQGM